MKKHLLAVGIFWTTLAVAQTKDAQPALSLEQAIQEALANNLDLAAEKLNISVAEAREITAKLRPNPVLTVSGQSLNILGARYTPATPLGPNQFNLHTDFPIERGHKREERVSLAKEEKTLAELGVREVMRQVISNVQNSFVDVQQAKENLELAQLNLRTLEGIVAINEARLQAGDLAQVELDRSRLATFQYRTAVQQAQLQLDQAKIQLQRVMGRKQKTTDLVLSGELRSDAISQPVGETLKLALARRPDYLAGQESQARSRADLRLQLANGKADYVVGTEYTRQSAWGVAGSSVGVYFSMPLRVFNRNQGEIARSQREISLAAARIQALQEAIETEVDKAYRQYTVARQIRMSAESDMLARAKTVRDTMEYSYKRGEASLIEFLDAQRAYNDAMQTLNDARANYARSLYWLDTVSAATVSGS